MNLIEIARQAKRWKEAHEQAIKNNKPQQKQLAVQQLLVLQNFLKDEFGKHLSDQKFTETVKKSNLYDSGLSFLLPDFIKHLKEM